MGDLIKRSDAISIVHSAIEAEIPFAIVADLIKGLPSADAEPKRVLQGYNKGANTIQTIRHEELTQIANIRKAVASADAVQGEWQKVEEQPYFRKHYDTVCCSVCRKKGDRKWNFCPNCGARMKGGDTE